MSSTPAETGALALEVALIIPPWRTRLDRGCRAD